MSHLVHLRPIVGGSEFHGVALVGRDSFPRVIYLLLSIMPRSIVFTGCPQLICPIKKLQFLTLS
jgi:hypothetical protein